MNIGDKVSWTHITQRAHTFSMQRRDGIIKDFDGDVAIVKMDSGRTTRVPTHMLRHPSEKSDIQKFIEDMR